MMGESRIELLAWVNELLQLSYTKIEQLGKGAAYCQIVDSIYGDVQMSKVKFNANQEYEYIQNYKILQVAFNKHKIEREIPIGKLVKCKFQDNLEFLQWLKHFHDNVDVPIYDPIARRKDQPSPANNGRSASRSAMSRASNYERSSSRVSRNGYSRPLSSASRVPTSPGRSPLVEELRRQLTEMQRQLDTLERERDFYYTKLREVEQVASVDTEEKRTAVGVLRELHGILYGSVESFIAPEEVNNMNVLHKNLNDMHLQEYDSDESF
ncbi:microtubule integrity protein mal3 [Basidiobolus ranarum]|uniref:Microtubule integrity protein mal3 n=1 Tax=Basidiobolus ranarum TaxID=34480 RepID=A0ABR2WYP6_9FUNG